MSKTVSPGQLHRDTKKILAWLRAPWPAESLDAQEKCGHVKARLYPFLRQTVNTPRGEGVLVQVLGKARVVVEGKSYRFSFYEVFPQKNPRL